MDKQELKDKISEIANTINELLINNLEESNNGKAALEKVKELNELLVIFNYISDSSNVSSYENPIIITEENKDSKHSHTNLEETDNSLNFKLGNPDKSGNTLNKKQISNLTSSIGINERFLLIKDLFEGSVEKFNESIDLLNNCNNKEDANELISSTMRIEYGWEEESEALTILSDLIDNRFSH